MPPSDLDLWQFRLWRSPPDETPLPGDTQLGAFTLRTGAGLNLVTVTDSAGQAVGGLLGFPLDLAAKAMLHGPWQVPFPLGDDPDGFAERVLDLLGGLFLWVFTTEAGLARIYMDCSAQVPCVFDAAAGMAGSTSHALFDDAEYDRRFNKALYDQLGVVGQGWFPGGLTAHQGVERVLPNHYLDLQSWTAHRHWPKGEIAISTDPAADVAEIGRLVTDQLEAVLKEPKSMVLALTAGRETRMILACARPMLDRIGFVTVIGPDRHALDTAMARRIARDMKLRHRELPRVAADADAQARHIRRGGHCVGDSNAVYHPSVWPLAADNIFVGGLGGEIGRAFLWKPSDRPDTPLTVVALVNCFGLPPSAEVTARIADWLRDVPVTNTHAVLDLAYIEHRMGPWYAAQFCCDPTLVRLAPLMCRRITKLMVGLPADWKLSERLGNDVIAAHWPELARYPFNTLGPWRDALNKLQRVLKNPELVLKKLRKLRG